MIVTSFDSDLSFWEKHFYGETATFEEKVEREAVVSALLDCHTRLISLPKFSKDKMGDTLINEACCDLLESVAKILHADRDEIQKQLLDLDIWERTKRVREYVEKAR
jgi:hypothetical protein